MSERPSVRARIFSHTRPIRLVSVREVVAFDFRQVKEHVLVRVGTQEDCTQEVPEIGYWEPEVVPLVFLVGIQHVALQGRELLEESVRPPSNFQCATNVRPVAACVGQLCAAGNVSVLSRKKERRNPIPSVAVSDCPAALDPVCSQNHIPAGLVL